MKVGDIVARKSYNKDIVFKITDIIVDENGKKIAILKGVAFRIIADAELSDLEILKPPDIREILMDKNVESILYRSLKRRKIEIEEICVDYQNRRSNQQMSMEFRERCSK